MELFRLSDWSTRDWTWGQELFLLSLEIDLEFQLKALDTDSNNKLNYS